MTGNKETAWEGEYEASNRELGIVRLPAHSWHQGPHMPRLSPLQACLSKASWHKHASGRRGCRTPWLADPLCDPSNHSNRPSWIKQLEISKSWPTWDSIAVQGWDD